MKICLEVLTYLDVDDPNFRIPVLVGDTIFLFWKNKTDALYVRTLACNRFKTIRTVLFSMGFLTS